MMGCKARAFGPLPAVTLEELVPPDHSYRHLERSLDLRFVRDLVGEASAAGGRPSIAPVVFFKLQLIASQATMPSSLDRLVEGEGVALAGADRRFPLTSGGHRTER